MKLRLFILKCGNRIHPEFYASKPEAKAARDELNKTTGEKWSVFPGPDHWRYEG